MYRLTNSSSIVRIADGASIPASEENPDYLAYLAWLAEGNTPLPTSDGPEQQMQERITELVRVVQAEMDGAARARRHDNLLSACSYAAQPAGAPFQAEGAAFTAWRSAVWSQTYAMLDEVAAGTRPMPTPEEAVAAMPALVLP